MAGKAYLLEPHNDILAVFVEHEDGGLKINELTNAVEAY